MQAHPPTNILEGLVDQVSRARCRLANAQACHAVAKEQSRLARQRRKEAKRAARLAKKTARQAKERVARAEASLARFEARLALVWKHQRQSSAPQNAVKPNSNGRGSRRQLKSAKPRSPIGLVAKNPGAYLPKSKSALSSTRRASKKIITPSPLLEAPVEVLPASETKPTPEIIREVEGIFTEPGSVLPAGALSSESVVLAAALTARQTN